MKAADHCIRYLLATKEYRITYGDSTQSAAYLQPKPPEFLAASDASYGDDPETRRSSEGWVFMMFGGPIDWKATKQTTVTKSSTEAELLSLSHAGSELLWWKRIFAQIKLEFDHPMTLHCDNRQTLRIITKEASKLDTKLRHVDIHQHWLRQEHTNGNLTFHWLPTSDMPADGLTKLLPKNKHEAFMKQMNLHQDNVI